MKLLFLLSVTILLASGVCNFSMAQGKAAAKGDFEMALGANAAPVKTFYNVATTSANNLEVHLVPDQPFELNARIVNSKGQFVKAIPVKEVGLRYVENIDVSSLPSGDYFIEIVNGNTKEKNYRIPFTK